MKWYTTKQGVKYRLYDNVNELAAALPKWPPSYTSGYRKWIRIPAGFDIETTRIGKHAYMYHWQFAIGDQIILGRTWEQYETLIYYLQNWLEKYQAWLIIWVANLGHEFAFLCRRFSWDRIFAKSAHNPLTAETGQIQYRECLSLSGIGGLKQLAKQYTKTQKLSGDLDYDKIRNQHTPLTETERAYCINDVAILSEWGESQFVRWIDGNNTKSKKIPLTATGICRDAVKRAAGKDLESIQRECRLTYPSRKLYNMIMTYLFRGGFTHANVYWARDVVSGVVGADFTSSYPAVMLHNLYPVGRFFDIRLRTDGRYIIDDKMDRLCCWFTVKFYKICATSNHHIESDSKIINGDGVCVDNGRLVRADEITVMLTDVDYLIYKMFYSWDRIKIIDAQGCPKKPLPEYVIMPLIDAYTKKCELKRQHMDGTPEYIQAKSMVNSYYGMTVQRLNFDDVTWTRSDGWKMKETEKLYDELIKDVFLSPWWGIWVTAHARYQLLAAVHRLDPDFDHNNVLYCDTDSIYMIASPDNISAIADYNSAIEKQNANLPECCSDLGCFDWIDNRTMYKFKTLGAKRYIKLSADGHAAVTVAGMRDGTYLDSIATDDPPAESHFEIHREIHHDDGNSEKITRYVSEYDFFANFEPHLILSMYESGKTTPLYTEKPYSEIVDGVEMAEMCGVAIYPIPFTMMMSDLYLELIDQIHEIRRKPIQY